MKVSLQTSKWLFLCVCASAFANSADDRVGALADGFVSLPRNGFSESAYLVCNSSGNYGKGKAKVPAEGVASSCFVSNADLYKSENYAPVAGFKMVGMLVSDVAMPQPHIPEENTVVAVLTDTFWRNESKTECILGTHLYMQNAPLKDGSYWEVSDIARAGFANKDVEIAYFYKPHSEDEGGNTEVLFRAGRTFTSVPFDSQGKLPSTKNAPSPDTPISKSNTASVSDNWVNFTTDVSFKDSDTSTRQMTSMLYIKYPCDSRDVVEKPNAIRLRSTGQNGQLLMEIPMPGLVPVDGVVERY